MKGLSRCDGPWTGDGSGNGYVMGPGLVDGLQTGDESGNGTGNGSWYLQAVDPGEPMEPGLDRVQENAGSDAARMSGTMTISPIMMKKTTP